MIIENRSLKYNPIYKKIYYLHKSMMNRCYLKSNSAYKNYGAKGVYVSEEWQSLDGFIETIDKVDGFDLEKILLGELQLDKDIKIKGNKVYSVETCSFVTKSQNSGNRPSNVCEFVAVSPSYEITYHTNREEFCRNHNLDSSTVWRMLNRDKSKKRVPVFYKGWQFFYQESFSEKDVKKERIILATNIDDGRKIEFRNIKEFAKTHNVNHTSIVACLKGRQNKAGRWKFEIIQEGVA